MPAPNIIEKPSTIGGIPLQTMSDQSNRFKALIYGDPGVGKTKLTAGAHEVEEMKPVLFIDIEGGTKTIKNLYPDMDVIRIKHTLDKNGKIVKQAWLNLFSVYEALRSEKYTEYKTIIIDSITEAYYFAMQYVMDELLKDPKKSHRDPDIPDKREYNKTTAIVVKMVKSFRDLDKNVLFTALKSTHTTQDTDTNTQRITNYTASLPGKLAFGISAAFDELYYLDVTQKKGGDKGEYQRRLLTQPVNKYVCKTRSDLPMTILDPTMPMLAEMVGLAKKEK